MVYADSQTKEYTYVHVGTTRDVNTSFFLQTGFWLLKTGFKPVFGFTKLNINIKQMCELILSGIW